MRFQVEIFDVQLPSHFACTVVLDAWATRSPAAVCHVDLVPYTPWCVLIEFRPLIIHVPSSEVIFDEASDGTVFDESRQDFYREAKKRRNTTNIGFGTGRLHLEGIAAVKGLVVYWGQACSHAGGNDQ